MIWNNIVNTALMGTGRKQLLPADLPPALHPAANAVLDNRELDAETQFLHLAALALNYRQSGAAALDREGVSLPECPPEELPYCSPAALQALQDALDMDVSPLIAYWLENCSHAGQLATPEFIPALLDRAITHKLIRKEIVAVCGKRGQWLRRLNPGWQFPAAASAEESWQTGTLEERRTALQEIRRQDPAQGREWLQQTWAQENAATRADLLKQLAVNLGEADAPWLETLLKDKSQKVKEEAWNLLKLIPGSFIVQAYWQVLQQAITPVQEKALLGMISRNRLRISLTLPLDKVIGDSGIEMTSNVRNTSDETFILHQLISSVPPAYWEAHLKTDKEGVLQLFSQEKQFISALGTAVAKFKDLAWLRALMRHSDDMYLDALYLLPVPEQEAYALQFLESATQEVIRYMASRTDEWGLELTQEVFRWMARNPYHYNRSFFSEHIRRIPVAIAGLLEKCAPQELGLQVMWTNTSEHILKLLSCKERIKKAF